MGRNYKFSKEEMIEACKDYQSGKGSFNSISKNLGVNKTTFESWYKRYIIHGSYALDQRKFNNSYTKEFKLKVINEYLTGKVSMRSLAAKYAISIGIISKWVKKYYNGIEIKNYTPIGGVYIMESRKTTFEERLEIVRWVIANDMNYKEAADKNGIKYALIYQWVKKYLKDGSDGLKYKNRGPKKKGAIDESLLSEVERLKLELGREKALRERAEFRLELYKKKEEFKMKRLSRK